MRTAHIAVFASYESDRVSEITINDGATAALRELSDDVDDNKVLVKRKLSERPLDFSLSVASTPALALDR